MTRSSAGFSLTEMVIVLAIFSALTLVVLPYVDTRRHSSETQDAAQQVANLFKRVQIDANRYARPTHVRISFKQQRLIEAQETGERIELPGGVYVRVTSAKSSDDPSTATFIFLPSGESTGGSISIGKGDSSSIVSVDWLTGRIEVSKARPASQ